MPKPFPHYKQLDSMARIVGPVRPNVPTHGGKKIVL